MKCSKIAFLGKIRSSFVERPCARAGAWYRLRVHSIAKHLALVTQKYIISLSSIPPRFGQLQTTLDSLLAQTVRPEKIILYINREYRRFPNWDGVLPNVPEGVEIRRVDEDFGPATKILPAVRDFRESGFDILFCDDDQVYRPHLAECLLSGRKLRPNDAVAVSGMMDFDMPPNHKRQSPMRPRRILFRRSLNIVWHLKFAFARLFAAVSGKPVAKPGRRRVLRAGFADGLEGWMGAMVDPRFFPDEVFDLPDFAWPVDDVWLSGHLMRNGHGAWIIGSMFGPLLGPFPKPSHRDETALHKNQFDGVDRGNSNVAVVRYFQETYGIWL